MVKQEMASVNINILGISELKLTGINEFKSDHHYIYCCGQEALRRNGVAFIFLGSKITADGDCSHEIKMLTPWKESYDQLRQHIKKQRHYFVNKGPSSQGYGFSSGHVWM